MIFIAVRKFGIPRYVMPGYFPYILTKSSEVVPLPTWKEGCCKDDLAMTQLCCQLS